MTNYVIEIANRIESGRAVGTDYVVTIRAAGYSAIVATFTSRCAALAFIEGLYID